MAPPQFPTATIHRIDAAPLAGTVALSGRVVRVREPRERIADSVPAGQKAQEERDVKRQLGWLVLGFSLAASGAAAASFDGQVVTTTWEMWSVASPGAGGTWLATTDTAVVTASDAASPDITGFHSSTGNDYELWDIDFSGNQITLTYTSIYAQDHEHQYMYMSPVGFHFADLAGVLPTITGVAVDASIAPTNFNATRVSFGADDIWVDLRQTMCHYGSTMMANCDNPASPTGFNNRIVLTVSSVPEPGTALLLMLGLGGLGFATRRA